jgi:hypothetical protein
MTSNMEKAFKSLQTEPSSKDFMSMANLKGSEDTRGPTANFTKDNGSMA